VKTAPIYDIAIVPKLDGGGANPPHGHKRYEKALGSRGLSNKQAQKRPKVGADHLSAHYRTKLYLASLDLIC
jgi:hypothetical protein